MPARRGSKRIPHKNIKHFRGLTTYSDQNTTSINPAFAWTRSQDLEPIYLDAGEFYCGYAKS